MDAMIKLYLMTSNYIETGLFIISLIWALLVFIAYLIGGVKDSQPSS